MQKVYFLRGCPGSGKSTIARAMLSENPNAIRSSMDDVRRTIGVPYSKESEQFALKIHNTIVLNALRDGKDVVVDNVHAHPAWPRRIALEVFDRGYDVQYEIVDVESDLDTCLARNQFRRESPQFIDSMAVPDDAIRKASQQIESRRKNGSLWTIDTIAGDLPKIEPQKRLWGLPSAVLCDLDGTLAIHAGRDPYDTSRCEDDHLCTHVDDVLAQHHDAGAFVILLSGRSEEFRPQTVAWLERHGVAHTDLMMRNVGDQRRDSIVKLELFNRNIRGQYNVEAVYDDRSQVCSMWSALGLPLFRVGDPNADF